MALGAVLNPNGNRYVLYLHWNRNNQVVVPGHSSLKRLQPATGHLADLYQRGCKLAGAAIV